MAVVSTRTKLLVAAANTGRTLAWLAGTPAPLVSARMEPTRAKPVSVKRPEEASSPRLIRVASTIVVMGVAIWTRAALAGAAAPPRGSSVATRPTEVKRKPVAVGRRGG